MYDHSIKSGDFKSLQEKWYQKLKDEGFEDIEDDKHRIYQYHSTHFRCKHTAEEMDLTLTYYLQCEDFYNGFKGWRKYEKEIWHLHCQGFSRRKIAQSLKSIHPLQINIKKGQLKLFNFYRVALHQSRIQTILTRLKKIMQKKKRSYYDRQTLMDSGVTEGMNFAKRSRL